MADDAREVRGRDAAPRRRARPSSLDQPLRDLVGERPLRLERGIELGVAKGDPAGASIEADDTRDAMCGRMTQQRPPRSWPRSSRPRTASTPRRPLQPRPDRRRRGRGPARGPARDRGLPLGPDPPLVRLAEHRQPDVQRPVRDARSPTGLPLRLRRSAAASSRPTPTTSGSGPARSASHTPSSGPTATDRARRAVGRLEGRGHRRGHPLVHDHHDGGERDDGPDPRPDAGDAPGGRMGSLARPGPLEGEALAELKGLLVPSDEDWLELFPVSRRVNDVRNDGPDLVEPIPDPVARRGVHPGTSEPSRPLSDCSRAARPRRAARASAAHRCRPGSSTSTRRTISAAATHEPFHGWCLEWGRPVVARVDRQLRWKTVARSVRVAGGCSPASRRWPGRHEPRERAVGIARRRVRARGGAHCAVRARRRIPEQTESSAASARHRADPRARAARRQTRRPRRPSTSRAGGRTRTTARMSGR